MVGLNTGAENIKIDISPYDTIQRLKDVIQSTKGIPMDQYQLVNPINNRLLDNDKNLIQNGLRNGAIIGLVPIEKGMKFIYLIILINNIELFDH